MPLWRRRVLHRAGRPHPQCPIEGGREGSHGRCNTYPGGGGGAAPATVTGRADRSAAGNVPNQRILSAAEIAALVARGDALVSQRDIASARLFYERAAEAGDGWAALRMGATFDPAFLGRAGIPGEASNQQEALSWYRRARGLGRADG